MSIVTLYQNCFLGSDYEEVIDNAYLEEYLGTLIQKTYPASPNEIYLATSGSIPLALTFDNTNAFDYNYMKIEHLAGNPWYCFIDNIEVLNNTCLVYYTLDVWSTFRHKCIFREGMVEQTTNYYIEKPHRLTVNIESNDTAGTLIQAKEKINNEYIEIPYPKEVSVLLELQIYELESATDKQTTRETISCCLTLSNEIINNYYHTAYPDIDYPTDEPIWTEAFEWFINGIISAQGEKVFGLIGNDVYSRYFDIVNIWVLPTQIYSISDIQAPTYKITARNIDINLYKRGVGVTGVPYPKQEFIIPADYKILYFGAEQRNIVYNGLEHKGRYYLIETENYIQVYLDIDGVKTDVTNLYSVDMPFTSITGETAMQRKIASTLQGIQGTSQVVGGVVDMATGITLGTHLPKKGRTKASKRAYYGAEISAVSDVVGGVMDVVGGVANLASAFAKKYQSTYASSPSSSALASVFQSFTMFSLNKISNQALIDDSLEEVGYDVEFFIRDYDDFVQHFKDTFSTLNHMYVQFSFVRLYGKAPNVYVGILENILRTGVKIYYTSEINNG